MASKALRITYVSDASSVLRDFSKVGAGTTTLQGRMKSLTGSFSSLGLIAPVSIALVAREFVQFAADSINAAVESEQAVAQLAIAVGGSTTAYEENAAALQMLTGFSDEAIMAAQGILTRFKLTESQINQLMPLVLDYAAVTGQDVPSAATNLGKALLGNTRALKTIGVTYVATGKRAKDYVTLVDALQGSNIEGAASADTLATSQRKLAAKVDELKENFGRGLMPTLEEAIPVVEDLLPVFGDLLDRVVKLAEAAVDLKEGDLPGFFLNLAENTSPWAMALEAVNERLDANIRNIIREKTESSGLATTLRSNVAAAYSLVTDWVIQYAGGVDELVLSHRDEIKVARDVRLAELALGNTFLGIVDSANAVKEAQRELNALERKGKEGTKQYEEAMLAAIEAQFGLEASVLEYGKSLAETEPKQRDVIAAVKDAAAGLGIEKDALADVIAKVKAYINSLDGVPDRVTTDVALTGIDQAMFKLAAFEAGLHDVGVTTGGGNTGNEGPIKPPLERPLSPRALNVTVRLERRSFARELESEYSARGWR